MQNVLAKHEMFEEIGGGETSKQGQEVESVSCQANNVGQFRQAFTDMDWTESHAFSFANVLPILNQWSEREELQSELGTYCIYECIARYCGIYLNLEKPLISIVIAMKFHFKCSAHYSSLRKVQR